MMTPTQLQSHLAEILNHLKYKYGQMTYHIKPFSSWIPEKVSSNAEHVFELVYLFIFFLDGYVFDNLIYKHCPVGNDIGQHHINDAWSWYDAAPISCARRV